MITRVSLLGKTIDCHTHSGGINIAHYLLEAYPYCCTIPELISKMNSVNIDISVTFPLPNNQDLKEYPEVNRLSQNIIKYEPCLYYLANRRLLMESKMYGEERVLPFVIFSLYGDYYRQIEHINNLKDEYDIYGIKIHTSCDHINVTRIIEEPILLDFFEKLSLPIMIHSGFEDYSNAYNMCEVFKKLRHIRFCVAHAGRMNKDFLEQLYYLENVWIDISSIPILHKSLINKRNNSNVLPLDYTTPYEMIYYLIDKYPQKVLFGTDYPWVECGYLKNHKSIHNGNDKYKESSNVLRSLEPNVQRLISNENICDFLFGKFQV
ncbi:MAG: amidohydrolase family protein [Bacteroidales bacterium]|nr:amidohydrolase family protein [Bacteroidales bacterium]